MSDPFAQSLLGLEAGSHRGVEVGPSPVEAFVAAFPPILPDPPVERPPHDSPFVSLSDWDIDARLRTLGEALEGHGGAGPADPDGVSDWGLSEASTAHAAAAAVGGPVSLPRPSAFLGTAHPAKFADAVEDIIGSPVEVPGRLAKYADRPLLSQTIAPEAESLRDIVVGK